MGSDRPPIDAAALHQLGNHLQVILGFIELILADTPPEDPRFEEFTEIRDAALRAVSLIGAGDAV